MQISPFSERALRRPIGGATPLCVRLITKLHQNIVQTPSATYPKLIRIGPVAEKLAEIFAERFLLVPTVPGEVLLNAQIDPPRLIFQILCSYALLRVRNVLKCQRKVPGGRWLLRLVCYTQTLQTTNKW